jgi:hypothetical protein
MPIGLKTAGQRNNLPNPEDNPNYFTQFYILLTVHPEAILDLQPT